MLLHLKGDVLVVVEVVSSHGVRIGDVVNLPRVVVRHVVPLVQSTALTI